MKSQNIGIIGAGITGLSAAYHLSKAGHRVTVIESSDSMGGLAAGFQSSNWEWSLDKHYHHWFTNDDHILNLAKELEFPVSTYRPKTSILSGGKIYQFDSPSSLLAFPHLGFLDKFRTGVVMIILKLIPFSKHLEKVTAKNFLMKYGGKKAWDKLWGPLFVGKFGKRADKIPAIWFWARIKKRTQSLVYPDGGYKKFVDQLELVAQQEGVKVLKNTTIDNVKTIDDKFVLKTENDKYTFSDVICTLPTTAFLSITKCLPSGYRKTLKPLKGLGAVTLVLSMKKRFFEDNTYWLNINESGYPFLAVVEHTNFVDKSHYNNENLLYIGNYLENNHKYFDYSAEELTDEFMSSLQKINPKFSQNDIKQAWVFKSKFAQPIVPMDYSSQVPNIQTPIDGLYLANMQQVYPWDRGTNYAVELGMKVSDIIDST
ncbi:FAD-dependent oxidoreductase [Patescibacteria group bacterium]